MSTLANHTIFKYTASKYGSSVSISFEAVFKRLYTGTAYVVLWDRTAGAAAATLSDGGTGATFVGKSADVTALLADGHEYEVNGSVSGTSNWMYVYQAKIPLRLSRQVTAASGPAVRTLIDPSKYSAPAAYFLLTEYYRSGAAG